MYPSNVLPQRFAFESQLSYHTFPPRRHSWTAPYANHPHQCTSRQDRGDPLSHGSKEFKWSDPTYSGRRFRLKTSPSPIRCWNLSVWIGVWKFPMGGPSKKWQVRHDFLLSLILLMASVAKQPMDLDLEDLQMGIDIWARRNRITSEEVCLSLFQRLMPTILQNTRYVG